MTTTTEPLKPLRQIEIDDCGRFIAPKSAKDAAKLNDRITAHNEALAKYREAVASAQRGEVTGNIYELRERLDRETCELVANNLSLIEARRALRRQLQEEFKPHRAQRQAELDEARVKATAEAERVWPPTDSPNQYQMRAQMVEQLCRKEIAAVRWEPTSLHGSHAFYDDNDLAAAKRALCQMFATV